MLLLAHAWGFMDGPLFEQLDGELNGTCVDGKKNTVFVPTAYNFYTLEDIWTIGLNYSLLF